MTINDFIPTNSDKPIRGLRANCIFHDEFVWGKEGDFDELDAFIKENTKLFSEEVITVASRQEKKNDY